MIELLVVIAIIGILAAILFPVFGRARENARRSSCQSNLKQIALGFAQYTQDFDERLPVSTDGSAGDAKTGGWMYYQDFGNANLKLDPTRGSLFPYLKSAQIFVCPSDTQGQKTGDSYASNSCVFYTPPTGAIAGYKLGKSLAQFPETAKTMLMGEEGSPNDAAASTDDAYLYIESNDFAARHFDGGNLAFLDGHVKWFRLSRIKTDGFQIGGTGPANMGTPSGACP